MAERASEYGFWRPATSGHHRAASLGDAQHEAGRAETILGPVNGPTGDGDGHGNGLLGCERGDRPTTDGDLHDRPRARRRQVVAAQLAQVRPVDVVRIDDDRRRGLLVRREDHRSAPAHRALLDGPVVVGVAQCVERPPARPVHVGAVGREGLGEELAGVNLGAGGAADGGLHDGPVVPGRALYPVDVAGVDGDGVEIRGRVIDLDVLADRDRRAAVERNLDDGAITVVEARGPGEGTVVPHVDVVGVDRQGHRGRLRRPQGGHRASVSQEETGDLVVPALRSEVEIAVLHDHRAADLTRPREDRRQDPSVFEHRRSGARVR